MVTVQKPGIEHWKQLWDTWDLRVVILLSLFLQTFLIFSAPFRKRTGNKYIIIPMWSAYSLADVTANFAMGLVSRSQGNTTSSSGPFTNPELVAFWASFLLVHLGGPDTITAFSLEDNELWLRHLLQLVFQCATFAYVFILSLSSKNKLWLPTVLVFVAGFIKYIERTGSLNLASWRRFRDSLLTKPDPGPSYAKIMDDLESATKGKVPTRINFVPIRRKIPKGTEEDEVMMPLEDLDVVLHAHRFFQTFKGLLADLIFSYRERDRSRIFFLKRTARDAFKMVEVELSFLYEILYTKALVVRGKYGYSRRFVSFILIVASLVLFYLIDKVKQGFHKYDVGITYTLLFGAIALDIIAVLMFLLSDWFALFFADPEKPSLLVFRILRKCLNVTRKRWPDEDSTQHCTFSLPWFMQILRRRWSESISQFNLIDYCLHPRSETKEKIIGYLCLTNILDGRKYVKIERFSNNLRDFIFNELREKSLIADDIETAKEICSAKGDWVLRIEGCGTLLPYIQEADYDESLIMWHIATELCYAIDRGNDENKNFRKFSKLLSDYMLYLLIVEPTMMSAVTGIGHIRFRDTCAEAKKFFQEKQRGKLQLHHEEACRSILAVKTEYKPVNVKGDGSKSVLFDACILAKELQKLEEKDKDKDKWIIMSKVWVELLSYAACRCRASNHAAQLSKGGQLISVVWLLMAHFGLADQFQIREGHFRLQIIVEKK